MHPDKERSHQSTSTHTHTHTTFLQCVSLGLSNHFELHSVVFSCPMSTEKPSRFGRLISVSFMVYKSPDVICCTCSFLAFEEEKHPICPQLQAIKTFGVSCHETWQWKKWKRTQACNMRIYVVGKWDFLIAWWHAWFFGKTERHQKGKCGYQLSKSKML